MSEEADEVKVFRNADEEDFMDDLDAHDASQLAEDKKDVVLEAELESRPLDSDVRPDISKPQPTTLFNPILQAMQASPGNYLQNLMLMNQINQINQMRQYSPSFAAMMPGFQFHPASPSYMPMGMQMNMAGMINQLSPFYPNNGIPLQANLMRTNPLNQFQMNQMRIPYPGAPMTSLMNNMQQDTGSRRREGGKMKKDDHVKKPLNAFMWYMKENRPKILEEEGFKEKQSAELNKELGKRWHDLTKEDQQVYFELAKKDREDHKLKYPEWSARENYAINKRKKKKRDKSDENGGESKKCRARFGVNQQESWCKYCKRKKKCMYSQTGGASSTYASSDGGLSNDLNDRVSGSSGPSPLTSSMGGPSPLGPSPLADHQDPSDSESDIDDVADDDDPTLTDQAFAEMQQQEMSSEMNGLRSL